MPGAVEIKKEIKIPDGVEVSIDKDKVTVKGAKGSLTRNFSHPKVKVEKVGDKVVISCLMSSSKEKGLVGTFSAHINNMIKGVTKGFQYKMRILYSHFPIKATVKGRTFVIENFLGERYPRKCRIVGDVDVKVSGDTVTIEGVSIEDVGQTAANIELATKIKGYDPRVFQDGIYIISKGD